MGNFYICGNNFKWPQQELDRTISVGLLRRKVDQLLKVLYVRVTIEKLKREVKLLGNQANLVEAQD